MVVRVRMARYVLEWSDRVHDGQMQERGKCARKKIMVMCGEARMSYTWTVACHSLQQAIATAHTASAATLGRRRERACKGATSRQVITHGDVNAVYTPIPGHYALKLEAELRSIRRHGREPSAVGVMS